jgi:hypothetical protein
LRLTRPMGNSDDAAINHVSAVSPSSSCASTTFPYETYHE